MRRELRARVLLFPSSHSRRTLVRRELRVHFLALPNVISIANTAAEQTLSVPERGENPARVGSFLPLTLAVPGIAERLLGSFRILFRILFRFLFRFLLRRRLGHANDHFRADFLALPIVISIAYTAAEQTLSVPG